MTLLLTILLMILLAAVATIVGLLLARFPQVRLWSWLGRWRWLVLFVIVFLMIGFTLKKTLEYSGFLGPWTAGPLSGIDPTDPAQRAAVLAYAHSLDFDSVTHGAKDKNVLDTGTMTVMPEKNNHHTKRGDLTQGRIQLRIHVTHPAGYAPLGLPTGVSYVWVDRLGTARGMGGPARAVIIPDNLTDSVRTRRIDVHPQPISHWWNKAWAQWTIDSLGDPACWNCEMHSWCQLK